MFLMLQVGWSRKIALTSPDGCYFISHSSIHNIQAIWIHQHNEVLHNISECLVNVYLGSRSNLASIYRGDCNFINNITLHKTGDRLQHLVYIYKVNHISLFHNVVWGCIFLVLLLLIIQSFLHHMFYSDKIKLIIFCNMEIVSNY